MPDVRTTLVCALAALLALGCSQAGDDDSSMALPGTGAGGTVLDGAGGAAGAPPTGTGGGGTFGTPGTGGTAAAPPVGGSGTGGQVANSGGTGGTSAAGGASGGAGTGDSDAGMPADGGTGTDAGPPNDLPPTGTFPAVDDLPGDGPYTAKTVNDTGPSSGYTLFYPQEPAPDGVKNPIITWGNGGATTPVDYDYLLPHLATHGFVVIASNNSLVSGTELRDGLDWLEAQNDDASSPLYQRLHIDNAAGVGYSFGGLAVLDIGDDPRLVTMVIISGADMDDSARAEDLPNMHTPVAYLCTDDDASRGNCQGDYDMVTVPVFFGVMNGSTHTDVTEFLNLGQPAVMERLAGATTAWLRWQLMADSTQEPRFIGASCGLCSDPNWTVQEKNW